jgi:hypothetical protein
MRYLPPLVLIAMIFACKSPDRNNSWDSFVTTVSLHDTLPSLTRRLSIEEVQGYELKTSIRESVYYFEYETNHGALLREMALLPVPIDSAFADVQCRKTTDATTRDLVLTLLQNENMAKTFDWNRDLQEYDLYECLKAQHHLLLLNRHSDRVIHLIVERT